MQVEKRPHPRGERGVFSSLEEVSKRAAEGGVRPDVRRWAIEIIDKKRKTGKNVHSKRAQAEALLEAVQAKLWIEDPVGTEFIQGAHLTACTSDNEPCFHGGDCFPAGTLTLTSRHELVPIDHLEPGMQIWGLDRWSTVEAVAFKGELEVDCIELNNGSQVQLTPDHHVYVLECTKHPMIGNEDPHCSCREREEKRIRVSELREGMVMPAPERVPFGEGVSDDTPESLDRAYIEGLYIADGWTDKARFCISGKDGHPKEKQKDEVAEICERLDVDTSWHERYIRVLDADWARRCSLMGKKAPEKRFLTIDLDEGRAAESLRGVMADSGANTRGRQRTFTTTSRHLAVQLRVLHRMFGITCGWTRVDDHGGLGTNPVYRLGTRGRSSENQRTPWLLRVRAIHRAIRTTPCWDIQTDDHRVYLPEHDVTVSQCDDLTVLLAAACLSVGIDTLIVGHGYNGARQLAHVLCAVHIEGKWHYADASIYNGNGDHHPLGKCTPFVRETLHELPSARLLCDQSQCLVAGAEYNPAQSSQFQINGGTFVGVRGAPDVELPQPEDFAFRVRWLGSVEQSPDEQMVNYAQSVDPDKFYSDASYREEFITNGAGKAAAIACVAYGAGAVAPLCDAAGKEVAKVAIQVFNAIFGGDSAAAKREEDRKNKIAYYAGHNEASLLGLLLRRWMRSTIAELANYRKDMGSPVLNGEVTVCPSSSVMFSTGGQSATFPEHKCMNDERAIGYLLRKAGVPVEQMSGTNLYAPVFKWHGLVDQKIWQALNASIGGGMPSLNKAMGSTVTGGLGDIYDAAYNLVIDATYDTYTAANPMQPWPNNKPWTKEAFLSQLNTSIKVFARSYAQQQVKAVADHFTKSLQKFASEYVVEFAAKQAWNKANKDLVQKGSLKGGDEKPKGMSTTAKVAATGAAAAAIALVAYAYTSRTT